MWKCTLLCRVNIFFVGNSINIFVKVTTRNTQSLKLNNSCSALIIYLASMSIQISVYKKDSYTWFQTATIVWFLSLTLSKAKVLCSHLIIFIHFSLFFGKLMIANIASFIYSLNKILLNSKFFKLMPFLAFLYFYFFY